MLKGISFFRYLVLVFVALYLAGLCGVQMLVFPFFLALVGALLCSGHKPYVVGVLTIIIALLTSQEIYFLLGTFFSLFVMCVLGSIIQKGKQVKVWVQCCIFLLSLCVNLYFQVFCLKLGLNAVLFLVCALCSFYCFRKFLVGLSNQSFLFRLEKNELACLSFFIIVLAGGLTTIQIDYLNFFHLICVFLILVSTKLLSSGQGVIFSVLLGLGSVVTYADVSFIALFVLLSIVASFLESKSGIFSVLGVLIIELMLGYYFESLAFFSYSSLLEVGLAGIVFMCLPKSFLQQMRAYFVQENSENSLRDIVNRDRAIIKSRLMELSNVFFELDVVFKKMLKDSLPLNEAKELLIEDVKSQNCQNCKDKLKCHQLMNSPQKEIEKLMNLGFEKGKVSLLDVSLKVTNSCSKISFILNHINKLINQYKQYSSVMQNLDSSRLLLAEQLHGVAKIMQNLSIKFDEKISCNTSKEKEILQELERAEIPCLEVVLYGNDEISSIALLVRESKLSSKIEEVLFNCLNVKMQLVQNKPSEVSGWTSLIFEPKTKFSVLCGCATISKSENTVSGDCYSMQWINQGKFLLAISDGMGHGEKAHKNSELTISVIENFYKAGFENEIVLSSVNRLMSINQLEDFATLDMCVVDLEYGFVDFIKLGANPTYIRHKSSITVVEGSSLPLGVVDELKTTVKKSAIEEGDLIIMCSDGVADCFGGEDALKDFVTHVQISSPQEMADFIHKSAIQNCGGNLKDDMTTIIARVVKIS